MTDLQQSPPGYRGQDEPPGPPSCSSASFKYASHGHGGGETTPYKNSPTYPQEGYNKQNPPRGTGDYYHHKNETNRRSAENDIGAKKTPIAGYNEGYKKNTPGYKNDSGYSESLGFDSFSLPLNERDEASPPPTPPVRDASSLKGVCYGPGHEKYPSWPSAPERHPEDDVQTSGHSGSHRSKSWTDHTNYPKEKPAQYTRPHMKRPNPAFTQQLKTVMERCEKIPADAFESRNRANVEGEPRLWPRVDREGKPLGDAEYVAPSPPEREQQPSQTLSHADLEAYVRSYQDPQVSQVDLYQESTLTQAGLEEYTRVQHSQQASYAQSEGYHSYVSSVDSTTNTPFLDRLRRDSEAVAQRPTSSWDDTREGRDSVVTTSSGSASSSETLKWHGSMSDVSVSSGLPPRQGPPDKWHHGSMSDVSLSGLPQKTTSSHDKWQGSANNVSSSSGNSPSKTRQEKWQSSMNDRNRHGRGSLPSVIHGPGSDVCQTAAREGKWQESNIDEEAQERRTNGNWENSCAAEAEKYSSLPQPMPQSPGDRQNSLPLAEVPENWNAHHGSMSDVSSNGLQGSKQLIAHSARVQTPQRHHSESVLYLDRERSHRKLYPVSTTQPQDAGQSTRLAPTSPQQPQLSVAERINELEKQQQQQQMRYTYLDPEKRHRVSDPTLKAIQKKALLSFYERHHQASWRSEPQLAQGASPVPQSPPPQPPPRPRPPSSRRASSASDYASGTWRENRSRTQNNSDLPSPKHQHSNSCGSLSTDLLGPVIIGPAISIDDWVPERPPKKPHLRSVYNDRVPSPDLPPPSPPTVTEHEVLNCDDPLPPPPPELSDASSDNKENAAQVEDKRKPERDHERHKAQPERQSTRRSKHSHKREREKQPKSPPAQQFVRSSTLKQVDSDMVLENGVSAGFATHRMVATGRSSLRYPSTQKLMVNGRVAPVRRVSEERLFTTRPPAQLPDLISQRYSDSGNQRPAPQVPVEPRIIRQESMRVESTRIDASGLLRKDSHRLESSSGQRPQPQVPKSEKGTPQPTRPNYLPLHDNPKSSKYSENNHNFTIGSPIKTSYEASSKLFAEGSPQKYHEPPKYIPNSQRHGDGAQRNYYALPPKYADAPMQKPQAQSPMERYSAGSPSSPPPPPLAPRQNTPGRKSLPPPPRPAPPQAQPGSQSKASYLAYRRERGAPDSEGSYKRTMSPTARLDDWPPPRERDDPVLLRVTPHHPHPLHHSELAKSHSVDALHHRLEERTAHSVEVISKLSYDLSKKLQATEVRGHENNNHLEEKHDNEKRDFNQTPVDADRKERLSPQSIEVLNDRNRQLERERRKLAASCEPLPSITQKRFLERENLLTSEDFYRERTSTIEMTSQNVEMLNRRNAVIEKRMLDSKGDDNSRLHPEVSVDTRPPPVIEKPPPPTSSPPRSPELERRDSPASSSPTGAVPRRSGSCSSSSSSVKSSDPRSPLNTLPMRSPPKVSPLSSPTRNKGRSPSETLNSVELISISSRRKVSSPTQTDDTGSSNVTSSPGDVSPSYAKSSQTSDQEVTVSSVKRLDSFSRSTRMTYSPLLRPSGGSPAPSDSPVNPTAERRSPAEDNSVSTSPCVSPQPGIEGLTLVQRTEVVLRVNAATSDASSQTETLCEESSVEKSSQEPVPEPRRKLPEEIECEELSRDLASQLNPNDKLLPILVPAPEHKKPTDYVSGLFRVEATLHPRPRRRLSLEGSPPCPGSADDRPEDDNRNEAIPPTPTSPDPISPLSPSSAYFTTSEGKARFLTRYSRDVSEEVSAVSFGADGLNSSTPSTVTENLDLKQKKEELVVRLDKKLVVLRSEQEAVREEGDVNEALGARVAARVAAVARPAEASKYRLHVEEVGKITSLLLGLSGRLARAENALYGMPADHAERKILESKRDKLIDQLEEAKVLKNNIDKRSVNVSAILAKYLNDEEFADYQHFINMKAKLIMDGREIQDKVKLGEEQLVALKEAIN